MVSSDIGYGGLASSHKDLGNINCPHPFGLREGKVFVGGLAHRTSTADLNEYFRHFGHISDAVVMMWPDGNSRGFGYVTFWEEAVALSVIQYCHVIDGQRVDVKRAVPTTNKLFVRRLSSQTTERDLRRYFASFGTVSSATVMMDVTGRTRGFGFVCFLPGDEGKAAIDKVLSKKKHILHRALIEVKRAASQHEIARDRGTATSDSGADTPSDDGESFSDERSSGSVEGARWSASVTSSNKQRGQCVGNKPILDMNEPGKVFLSAISSTNPGATMSMFFPRSSFEPAHVHTNLDFEELYSNATTCEVQTGVPAKVYEHC